MDALTMERHLTYLRDALRELLQLPADAPDEDLIDTLRERLAERPPPQDAPHASAPNGYKCSDCTIDGEACPTCYAAWWTQRHPNHESLSSTEDAFRLPPSWWDAIGARVDRLRAAGLITPLERPTT